MKERGLTLVEVLVAVGISTIVGTLLLVVIVNSAGLFSQQSSKVQEGLSVNDALSSLRGSIKQASAVENTSGVDRIVLKVPAIDSFGNIIDKTSDNFYFYLDQNYLHFKIDPNALSSRKASDQILSNFVSNLNFQYFNLAIPPAEVTPVIAAKVRITLTLKQDTATTEANLRND